MRISIIFFLLVRLTDNIFCNKLLLSEDIYNRWNIIDRNEIIKSPDGNPLAYTYFLLFDNYLSTAVNMNNINDYKFMLYFNDKYPIDKIVIYNGYQKNKDIYLKNSRVKEAEICVLDETVLYQKVDNKKYYIGTDQKILFTTNIFFNEDEKMKVITFPKSFSANAIYFEPKSLYKGTKYNELAISEIEFWYHGEKYEIANLHKVMMAYSNGIVQERINNIPQFPVQLFLSEYPSENVIIINTLSKLGYKYSDIDCLELRKNDKGIYIYKKGFVVKDNNWSIHNIQYKNGIKIGKWKTDQWGMLWIKIGKNKWKMSKSAGFSGTDIECYGWDYRYDDLPFHWD